MGTFRIEITGVGGNGVDRERGQGEKIDLFEGGESTPDYLAKELVEKMKQRGVDVHDAVIIHYYPGEDEDEVIDDLSSSIRLKNDWVEKEL